MSRLQLTDSDLLRQQALFAGCWQDAHQGATLPVTDPATGETLATIPALGRVETEQAIDYAESVRISWGKTPHASRATLLSHVAQDNPAVQQEIFGPVLTVQTFDEEEQGLAMAAHDTYGLCAGVHTLSLPRALRAMRAIEAGTVWINRYGRSGDFIIPTGGFLGSGIGKDLGRQAFQACQRQ